MARLTDTQLVILSTGSRRNDRGVDLPTNVTGEAVRKAVDELIRTGLLEEVASGMATCSGSWCPERCNSFTRARPVAMLSRRAPSSRRWGSGRGNRLDVNRSSNNPGALQAPLDDRVGRRSRNVPWPSQTACGRSLHVKCPVPCRCTRPL